MLWDKFEQRGQVRRWNGYALVKRTIDLCVCLVLLPLLALIVLLVAVAILIDSGWPVLFVQERVGRNGRLFRMYKFRTLKSNYNAAAGREFMQEFIRGRISRDTCINGQRLYKPFDETQITRLGRLLRKTSLDELPQVVNVLLGQMSLVGPRPNILWEVEAYEPWHNKRLLALPGITGLAQVRGRSCISFNDIVRYDVEYVENQSLKLDTQILWWTVVTLVKGRGAG